MVQKNDIYFIRVTDCDKNRDNDEKPSLKMFWTPDEMFSELQRLINKDIHYTVFSGRYILDNS
jgi:hypothetical protein